MKITILKEDQENHTDLYLCGDGENPPWLNLRFNRVQGRLAGFSGSPISSGLAQVRPVTFASDRLADDALEAYASWIFMQLHDLQIAHEDVAPSQGNSALVQEWEAFLGNRTQSAAAIEDNKNLELPKETLAILKHEGLLANRRNALVPAKQTLIRPGHPVSGFMAIKAQRIIANKVNQVPMPPVLDLDTAAKALKAVARPSIHAVSWYGAATGDIATIRLQAAQSFPLFAGMMADAPGMARAIDARQPLQPLLMQRTGLSKAGLKRLSGISQPLPAGNIFENRDDLHGEDALGVDRQRRFMISGNVDLETALSYLSQLAPDRVPKDDASWMAYHDILSGCAIPLENALDLPAIDILNASKGNWIQFRDTLARAADFDPADFSLRTFALCTIDALEAIEDFSRSAILPQALQSITQTGESLPQPTGEFFQNAFAVAKEAFIGHAKNPAVHLLEASRRYASRIPALMDATGFHASNGEVSPDLRWQKYGDSGFPILTGSFETRSGPIIRPLRNFEDMREETARLKHCVGRAYLQKARNCRCHLFSVQSRDGKKSFSTVEISRANHDDLKVVIENIRIVQHRGLENALPSKEAAEAVQQWFDALKRQEVEINLAEVREWQKYVQTIDEKQNINRTPTWSGSLGMDWTNEENRHAAWNEWRHIIGGPFRKAESPEAIYRMSSARNLVAVMAPKAAAILSEQARERRNPNARNDDQSAAPAP